MKIEKYKKLLEFYKQIIDYAKHSLVLSLEKCRKIDLNTEISFEEQESLDSLNSKFARLFDILVQKILVSIILLNREEAKTFIDKANFAEKIGLIDSAKSLIDIRDLRNEIAHEYVIDDLIELYKKTIELSEHLIDIIDSTLDYLKANKNSLYK